MLVRYKNNHGEYIINEIEGYTIVDGEIKLSIVIGGFSVNIRVTKKMDTHLVDPNIFDKDQMLVWRKLIIDK